MEYYSAIKNNAFKSVLMRWMKLEHIIQSKVSQKENPSNYFLTGKLKNHISMNIYTGLTVSLYRLYGWR